MTSNSRSSIYLVSDPRMAQHRPVPPPSGQAQHRQLDPPCERPDRLVRIMERLQQLERNLIGLRGGGGSASGSRGNSAVPSLQNSAASLGSAGSGGSTRPRLVRGGGIIPSGSPERNRQEVAPFVKANCRPVSRETGEFMCGEVVKVEDFYSWQCD